MSLDFIHDDEVMKRHIRHRCGGLVEVKTLYDTSFGKGVDEVDGNSIRFIHQSVRDVLELHHDQSGAPLDSGVVTEQGHSILGRACMAYLCLSEVQEISQWLKIMENRESNYEAFISAAKFPFLVYAEEHWKLHCQEVDMVEDTEALDSDMTYSPLINSAIHFDNWRHLHNKFHPTEFLG